MTGHPIPAAAVEKAARAIYESGAYGGKRLPWGVDQPGHFEFDRMQHRVMAEAVIAAFGLKVEHDDSPDIWVDRDGDVDVTQRHLQRLVGPWEQVETCDA